MANQSKWMILSTLLSGLTLCPVWAADVRTVKLNQTNLANIFVAPGRSTVLSFPTKPTKVILGNQGSFAIEYVESDLAIGTLSSHSTSNLFVYLDGRRFAFNLKTIPNGGDTIVMVRDAPEPDLSDVRVTPHLKHQQKTKR